MILCESQPGLSLRIMGLLERGLQGDDHGTRGEMRTLGIAIGVMGVLWLAYFWMAVFLYPYYRVTMPGLKMVETITLGSAVAFAFSGKTVSRYWWSGVAASLLTFTVIMVRVG